ncbi:dihydroorotase [Candidatus Planktophila lacus]|uniref:Dihydroorotase n=1 Tax=Candidatus Planktophila lacus TaxID=1884913 RepID=A0AAC9YQQ4_9ACTN|nr:dihydroorotase [Candidatus Planktophila lacus]ASY10645.1 dihydroorotase [Candidatus Planktophila lacus]
MSASNSNYLLSGLTLPDGTSSDIQIANGVITAIGKSLPKNSTDEVIDFKGSVVLPGLVDLHTHLREPGKEDAETVLSGSMAAAKGGFVAISAMANTSPVADTAGVVEQVYALGQSAGFVDVFPIGAVTQGLNGETLSEIGAMADSNARVRVFSDDGNCVHDPLVMRRALEYVKKFNGVIAQHAQEPALTIGSQMNEGVNSSRLGLKGWPAVAEEAIIARDVLLADHVQSRLHICHLTTAGGVDIIRWAKARGINVTAEVTPHHLLLTDDYANSYDPIFKVNPPLRTQRDVEALREGLADGTIDIVATDHAPHPAEAKECEWQEAAFGMLGLESALSIVNQTMVQTGLLNWEGVAERMSRAPSRIAGYVNHGGKIEVGAPAHLTVINPTQTYRVDRDLVASRSRNTPFHGMELAGVIQGTFFRGIPTYLAGQLTSIHSNGSNSEAQGGSSR